MRFSGTETVSPVFGLRPSLVRLIRKRKLPKPRISVFSPFFNASRIESKMQFTTFSASRRLNVVAFSVTFSIKCAFVIALLLDFSCMRLFPYGKWGETAMKEQRFLFPYSVMKYMRLSPVGIGSKEVSPKNRLPRISLKEKGFWFSMTYG